MRSSTNDVHRTNGANRSNTRCRKSHFRHSGNTIVLQRLICITMLWQKTHAMFGAAAVMNAVNHITFNAITDGSRDLEFDEKCERRQAQPRRTPSSQHQRPTYCVETPSGSCKKIRGKIIETLNTHNATRMEDFTLYEGVEHTLTHYKLREPESFDQLNDGDHVLAMVGLESSSGKARQYAYEAEIVMRDSALRTETGLDEPRYRVMFIDPKITNQMKRWNKEVLEKNKIEKFNQCGKEYFVGRRFNCELRVLTSGPWVHQVIGQRALEHGEKCWAETAEKDEELFEEPLREDVESHIGEILKGDCSLSGRHDSLNLWYNAVMKSETSDTFKRQMAIARQALMDLALSNKERFDELYNLALEMCLKEGDGDGRYRVVWSKLFFIKVESKFSPAKLEELKSQGVTIQSRWGDYDCTYAKYAEWCQDQNLKNILPMKCHIVAEMEKAGKFDCTKEYGTHVKGATIVIDGITFRLSLDKMTRAHFEALHQRAAQLTYEMFFICRDLKKLEGEVRQGSWSDVRKSSSRKSGNLCWPNKKKASDEKEENESDEETGSRTCTPSVPEQLVEDASSDSGGWNIVPQQHGPDGEPESSSEEPERFNGFVALEKQGFLDELNPEAKKLVYRRYFKFCLDRVCPEHTKDFKIENTETYNGDNQEQGSLTKISFNDPGLYLNRPRDYEKYLASKTPWQRFQTWWAHVKRQSKLYGRWNQATGHGDYTSTRFSHNINGLWYGQDSNKLHEIWNREDFKEYLKNADEDVKFLKEIAGPYTYVARKELQFKVEDCPRCTSPAVSTQKAKCGACCDTGFRLLQNEEKVDEDDDARLFHHDHSEQVPPIFDALVEEYEKVERSLYAPELTPEECNKLVGKFGVTAVAVVPGVAAGVSMAMNLF